MLPLAGLLPVDRSRQGADDDVIRARGDIGDLDPHEGRPGSLPPREELIPERAT